MKARQQAIRLIQKRVEQRSEREMPAFVYRPDGTRIPATLIDLSYSGCRLRSHHPLPDGETLKLVMVKLGADISLTIQWTNGREFGAKFLGQ
jgi:hypothetical protein